MGFAAVVGLGPPNRDCLPVAGAARARTVRVVSVGDRHRQAWTSAAALRIDRERAHVGGVDWAVLDIIDIKGQAMINGDRRLRTAIRLTPRNERDRYAEEWEHDLAEATDIGANPPGVVRGATRVALRRRARWGGQALLGGRGIGAAVLLWIGIIALMALAFLGGGVFGVALVVALVLVVVGFMFAGRPSLLTFWLMAGSAVTGVCAAAYVWWVLGVQIDAADTFTPAPAAAGHGGVGLVVLGLSIVLFVVSAIVGYARRPH